MKKTHTSFIVIVIVIVSFIFGVLHQNNMTHIEQERLVWQEEYPDMAISYIPFPWPMFSIFLAFVAGGLVEGEN